MTGLETVSINSTLLFQMRQSINSTRLMYKEVPYYKDQEWKSCDHSGCLKESKELQNKFVASYLVTIIYKQVLQFAFGCLKNRQILDVKLKLIVTLLQTLSLMH